MIYNNMIGNLKIQAKIYDTGSQYGINEGRISKLWIYDIEASDLVYIWDRGDEFKNESYSADISQIVNQLLKEFETEGE